MKMLRREVLHHEEREIETAANDGIAGKQKYFTIISETVKPVFYTLFNLLSDRISTIAEGADRTGKLSFSSSAAASFEPPAQ